ncbi:MAG: response regulator transcription factor [Acidimicrobiia bacterium]|nr:response regulator transcription factor [Acidimicrobiia bacterium]MDH5236574.1 response regulator transcription factor [Acidimicrobiia bacterium]
MSDPITVLVVDDEPAFREALRQALKREGFLVHLAADGEEALEYFRALQPDIVLLDVMLPRMSGVDVCRQIRSVDDTPVIMVSARNEEIDAVVALEIGADDYVSKPYRTRELIARMRTVLRRVSANPRTVGDAEVTVGDLHLDRERHEVTLAGQSVELPLKEFQVLAELMENQDLVVTRQDLINRVWGYDYEGDTKTLDVHIKRLRAKLEPDPANPQRIITVRGVGYKMSA